MQIQIRALGFLGGPVWIGVPAIGTALERGRLPPRFFTGTVQVVAEKWRFDVLAKFARGFMTAERNQSNAVSLWSPPLSVIPRARDHEICVLRIVFFRVTKNLPRPPRIFLVPESGNIQVGHG